MVPDGNTKIYKIAGRYIIYRNSLTNAKVKKYYSHSTDLKIFCWDLKINHTGSLNPWIKINLVSFWVSRKTWSFTNSRCYQCFVDNIYAIFVVTQLSVFTDFWKSRDQLRCLIFRHNPALDPTAILWNKLQPSHYHFVV